MVPCSKPSTNSDFVYYDYVAGNGSPEKNLMQSCSFYMGETVMSIQKVRPSILALFYWNNSHTEWRSIEHA